MRILFITSFQKFRKGDTNSIDRTMRYIFLNWEDPTPTFDNLRKEGELLEKNVMRAYNAKKKMEIRGFFSSK